MKRLIPFLVLATAVSLLACNLIGSLAENVDPATPPAAPATEAALPTPEPPTASATPALPPVPIVYYYFLDLTGKPAPAGSVVILPNELVLGPALSDIVRSPDATTNISSALQAMIQDPRNVWTSDDLGITSITFHEGKAEAALQGEIFGVGDIVLIAARMQILMTVLTEASVQAVVVTLNGENIANLGISHSSEAKPADYTYTRTEIETFMQENAYNP